jgi:hypothetical protein
MNSNHLNSHTMAHATPIYLGMASLTGLDITSELKSTQKSTQEESSPNEAGADLVPHPEVGLLALDLRDNQILCNYD